ncbi:hypothetical protein VTK56DRAFT_4154 [Thermocarpiscus australiensis]
MLDDAHLSAGLVTLEIDTSQSKIYTDAVETGQTLLHNLRTVPSLAHFTSLRHLAISIDAIYYPSLFPRVLLRDDHTGPQRLVDFLPEQLETLEIKGIYAIPAHEVELLGRACRDGRFPRLKEVVLESGGVTGRGNAPYDLTGLGEAFSRDEVEREGEKWGPWFSRRILELFCSAGVTYGFDNPEFFSDVYFGTWGQDYSDQDEPDQDELGEDDSDEEVSDQDMMEISEEDMMEVSEEDS